MIDTTTETVVTFPQAADELLRRRMGRKIHVSTFYRWGTAGCRGVRLETIQIGATRCTSREALQRFFERLTGPDQAGAGVAQPTGPGVSPRSPARRRRESAQAGKQLEQDGA